MKCEHKRICDNCKLDKSRDCCNCFNGLDHKKFSCKICKDNKPLTIAELEQMDGEPVWVTHKKCCCERRLVHVSDNPEYSRLTDKCGSPLLFSEFNKHNVKVYKQKPSPRMVTIAQAIEGKLLVKLANDSEYKSPTYQIFELKGCSDHTFAHYLEDACWEAKEVDN
jgi:hypothetical protein